MPDIVAQEPRLTTTQKRNLIARVEPRTLAFAEWVRCQYALKNEGHALDFIVDGVLAGRRFDVDEFIAQAADDAGQVTEAFATALVLFVGFIAFGGAAFIASVAYIQPILRALGFWP